MMKILHITNEITKKNFSISSLINYISYNGNKKKLFKSEILCSNVDFLSTNKELHISRIKWKNFFRLREIFLNKVKNYDVVHIHGMWAPIQLYSIILCLIYSKKTLIHPHGMLLYPAINDNGLIKKINKRIFLYILKFLFFNQKNIIFIAITKEEYIEIKKLFVNLKVKLIQNNIPFNLFKIKKKNELKKVFVFFGRIHPHKNIIEMINNFIDSDLIRHGWKLEIYGIPDDTIYLNRIKKLSNYGLKLKFLTLFLVKKKLR
jgi:glycosyltransferase involved in cell wall biosynthesis